VLETQADGQRIVHLLRTWHLSNAETCYIDIRDFLETVKWKGTCLPWQSCSLFQRARVWFSIWRWALSRVIMVFLSPCRHIYSV